jgi:aspartyl-tRNA(Asn)/glutamyl-tRNA(Gln) amidotransferase subunit A
MMAQMADLFEGYDLLLSPTMPLTAFPVRQYPQEIGGKEPYPDPAWGFIPFTHPINTLGNPAASIPCGFSSDGMPIGLHVVGRQGDEETVIRASAAFEQARPWIHHRPPAS